MSISGIGSSSSLSVQSLVDMRRQLDDLQRQLGSGKKSDNYAGFGLERNLAVGLRAHLSSLDAFGDAITQVGVRISVADNALGRISDIGHNVKEAATRSSTIDSAGSTTGQQAAALGLDEILNLLNSQAGDRYLFSGRHADRAPVETVAHIMDGDGARAGFRQVVAERKQADLGASGLGRVVVSAPTATSTALAEDVAGSPFGLKLGAIATTLTGAVVAGPAGVPPSVSVDLGATNPNAGETIQFRFTLPDGTSENIVLTATASATPQAGQFSIGVDTIATSANLQAALTAALGKLAATALPAASTMAAAADFFNVDGGNPPQRVSGPPFNTATSLIAGTPSNTVSWYTGDDGADPARSTATVRIDSSITVSYGLRANEEGLRWMVQNVAALAATTFSPGDPNAKARADALNQRAAVNLDGAVGIQKIAEIRAGIAGAQRSMASASERHAQTKSTLADMVDQIEGVPTEQVAAQIMALQTRLQASLQATALLYRTSLLNFI
jgi:flagellar hook-associated protein 3 FlgL